MPWPLALALGWVDLWRLLTPASLRTIWRDQWRADLWHYWLWLSREQLPQRARTWRLAVRAAAVPLHAFSLRLSEWSLQMLAHDLRLAWRLIIRRPAFTFVAVLILGLGIGANATIFSWVETILLKPLPGVADQDRIVVIRGTTPTRKNLSFSYPNFQDFRSARPDGLEDVMAFRMAAMNLRADGGPVRVWGELVTPNFFDLLRVTPMLGRGFLQSEGETPGSAAVAVISEALWRRVFAADASIVGRTVTLNGQSFTIIGVTQPGFHGSTAGLALDVFVPMTMQKVIMSGDRLGLRGNAFMQVFGRLSPGSSIDRAQASASVVAARLAEQYPDYNKGRGALVVPLYRDGASNLLLPVVATLMAVVGIVLLIACANLAGLLLAKAAGRQREVAVRLAVGASRGRLVRQFLIESGLLAAAGGAAGIVISYWTSGMLTFFVPPTPFPVNLTAELSPAVLAFSVATTVATALIFGLLPALKASRPNLVESLKESVGTLVKGHSRGRLRQALVVGQIALSVLLLLGAALFARSFTRAQLVDPGFSVRNGFLASLDVMPNGYDEARGIVFYQQLLKRIATLPGVEAVTITSAMPLDIGGGSDMGVHIDGYQPRPGEEISVVYNRVGPDYFETMGIPIVQGRGIDERDTSGPENAGVINETMARRYFAGRDAVGGLIRFGNVKPTRVVGVAKDGKYSKLNEQPQNYMYMPVFQFYRPDVALLVRTANDPAPIVPLAQSAIKELDANLPLFDLRTIEEHLQLSLFIPRMASIMLTLFGGLALLLATVGLYSVIAFTVAQRTREIGIRVALGAARTDIRRLILRQGVVISGLGIIVGLALGFVVSRLIASQLMVTSSDPVSFAGTAGALLIVSLAASLLPARRAASMDPLQALRRE
jgi:macrolide transport system ATP-binding/permease protein